MYCIFKENKFNKFLVMFLLIILVFCIISSGFSFAVDSNLKFANVDVSKNISNSNINNANTSRNLAVADDGTIYAVFRGTDSSTSITGIFVARSIDGGESFLDPVLVASGNYEPEIAVSSSGYVYVTFCISSKLQLFRSDDKGISFHEKSVKNSSSASIDMGAANVHMATDGPNLYFIGQRGTSVVYNNNHGDGTFYATPVGSSYVFSDVHVDKENHTVIVLKDNPSVVYSISNDYGHTFTPNTPTNGRIMFSVGSFSGGQNGKFAFMGGSSTSSIRIDVEKNIFKTNMDVGSNSNSQGRSMSADAYGNVVTGYVSGSVVKFKVSNDLGETFSNEITVGSSSIANAFINPTNGDILYLYVDSASRKLMLNTYKDLTTGYDIKLSSASLSFESDGAQKSVLIENVSKDIIIIEDLLVDDGFTLNSEDKKRIIGATLNPGDKETIIVKFSSEYSGSTDGILRIYIKDKSNTRNILLTGMRTDGKVRVKGSVNNAGKVYAYKAIKNGILKLYDSSDNQVGSFITASGSGLDIFTSVPNGDGYYVIQDVGGQLSNPSDRVSVLPGSDVTGPVITLNGEASVDINFGDSYSELGAVASDNIDGKIDVTISGNVDTSLEGTYSVSYKATDSAGNQSELIRTVNVLMPKEIIKIDSLNANGNYGIGDIISISVKFDKAVYVTGIPQIVLETGDVDALANYESGSGMDTLNFNYAVSENDISNDLDVKNKDALILNGGTIKNASGVKVNLELIAGNEEGALSKNKNLVIDGIKPTGSFTIDEGQYTKSQNINLTLSAVGASQMIIGEKSDLSDGVWENYNTSKALKLSDGEGTKTIYVMYRDLAGNETSLMNDSINYDSGSPDSPVIEDIIYDDNMINCNETKNFVLDGTGEPNSSISIKFSDSSGNKISHIAQCDSLGMWKIAYPGIDLSALGDGSIEIEIISTDHSNNNSESRKLSIIKDATSPEIILNGEKMIKIDKGQEYVEESVIINDANQTLLLIDGFVDINIEDKYVVTYKATDSAGNISYKERIVVVGDPDNYIGEIREVVTATEDGYYKSGDTVNIGLKFDKPVRVTGSPKIRLNNGGIAEYKNIKDSYIVNFEYFIRKFNETKKLNYNGIDSLETDSANYIFLRLENIDTTTGASTTSSATTSAATTMSATYVTTNSATNVDFRLPPANSGKNEMSIRNIIIDNENPWIRLSGPSDVSILQYNDYEDPLAEFGDNFGEAKLLRENKLDVFSPGLYKLTYKSEDKAGNQSDPTYRYITVRALKDKDKKDSDNDSGNSNSTVGNSDTSNPPELRNNSGENKYGDEITYEKDIRDSLDKIENLNKEKDSVISEEKDDYVNKEIEVSVEKVIETLEKIQPDKVLKDIYKEVYENILKYSSEENISYNIDYFNNIVKKAVEESSESNIGEDLILDSYTAENSINKFNESVSEFKKHLPESSVLESEDNSIVLKAYVKIEEGDIKKIVITEESEKLLSSNGVENVQIKFSEGIDLKSSAKAKEILISRDKYGFKVGGNVSDLKIFMDSSKFNLGKTVENPERISMVKVVDGKEVIVPSKYNHSTGKVETSIKEEGTYKLVYNDEKSKIFSDDEINEKLDVLKSRGIITASIDNGIVSRGNFVIGLVDAFQIRGELFDGEFIDFDKRDAPEEILFALSSNLIKGFDDGTLRINDPLTKEQQATIISRTIEYVKGEVLKPHNVDYLDKDNISSWALEAVEKIKRFKIYDDSDVFNPSKSLDGEGIVNTFYNMYEENMTF